MARSWCVIWPRGAPNGLFSTPQLRLGLCLTFVMLSFMAKRVVTGWNIGVFCLVTSCQSESPKEVTSKTSNDTWGGSSSQEETAGQSTGGADPSTPAPSSSFQWPTPSVTDPEQAEQSEARFETLSVCAQESACPAVVVDISDSGATVGSGALRCLLRVLADSSAGVYRHVEVGSDAEQETLLYVHPVRLAEVLTRITPSQGQVGFSARLLCSLAPAEFFENCLADLPEEDASVSDSSGCASPAVWLTGCAPAEIPNVQCVP